MANPQAISQAAALAYLQRFKLINPVEQGDLSRAVDGALCFSLKTPGGALVYALRTEGAQLRVSAAAGKSGGQGVQQLDAAFCRYAHDLGLKKIIFHTARRGLVKRCHGLGYRLKNYFERDGQVTGYAMEKNVV